MAPPVFRQRLLLSSEALVRGVQSDRIISSILDRVPMPEYRDLQQPADKLPAADKLPLAANKPAGNQ
jgi:hypothetical protein